MSRDAALVKGPRCHPPIAKPRYQLREEEKKLRRRSSLLSLRLSELHVFSRLA
jgi:hypothetical protein